MITIGLDLSINSTGVCVKKNNKYAYYIIASKLTRKQQAFHHPHVQLLCYDKQQPEGEYSDKESVKTYNIYRIVECIRTIIKKHKPDCVYIEGVSYGSTGSSALVDLSGLNYMVRFMLIEQKIPFIIVSPTQNKKMATGNGSADKDLMVDAWKRLDKTIEDIQDIKIDDLADSYFLANYQESSLA